MSLLIQNAKLISKNYEKLYWSIDENSSKVLKKAGCNIKTVSNANRRSTEVTVIQPRNTRSDLR